MQVVVTIRVIDDDGTELDMAVGTSESVEEAIEGAKQQLDVLP
jgi:hypothetical protein